MKKIAGAIISIVIGGSVFAISQSDVINNFSANTGLSQQEAEEYIKNISEDDLASFDEIGKNLINDGNGMVEIAKKIDCINYTYSWETTALTCQQGTSQLYTIGNDEVSLGRAYVKLDQDDADKEDISTTIPLIDKVNLNFSLPIVTSFLDTNTIEESKKTNSYNKSLLQTTLEAAQK